MVPPTIEALMDIMEGSRNLTELQENDIKEDVLEQCRGLIDGVIGKVEHLEGSSEAEMDRYLKAHDDLLAVVRLYDDVASGKTTLPLTWTGAGKGRGGGGGARGIGEVDDSPEDEGYTQKKPGQGGEGELGGVLKDAVATEDLLNLDEFGFPTVGSSAMGTKVGGGGDGGGGGRGGGVLSGEGMSEGNGGGHSLVLTSGNPFQLAEEQLQHQQQQVWQPNGGQQKQQVYVSPFDVYTNSAGGLGGGRGGGGSISSLGASQGMTSVLSNNIGQPPAQSSLLSPWSEPSQGLQQTPKLGHQRGDAVSGSSSTSGSLVGFPPPQASVGGANGQLFYQGGQVTGGRGGRGMSVAEGWSGDTYAKSGAMVPYSVPPSGTAAISTSETSSNTPSSHPFAAAPLGSSGSTTTASSAWAGSSEGALVVYSPADAPAPSSNVGTPTVALFSQQPDPFHAPAGVVPTQPPMDPFAVPLQPPAKVSTGHPFGAQPPPPSWIGGTNGGQQRGGLVDLFDSTVTSTPQQQGQVQQQWTTQTGVVSRTTSAAGVSHSQVLVHPHGAFPAPAPAPGVLNPSAGSPFDNSQSMPF
ncbi:unnamed protein product, partial [Choristocarpus tenellus]